MLFRGKYRIESARLKGWDYSSPGSHFVTICTKRMACYFGDVMEGKMRLSSMGEIVEDEWQRTPIVRSNVAIDEWQVMPNHLHGIVVIGESAEKHVLVEHGRASLPDLTKPNTFGPQRYNVASIIRGFKSAATKRIHAAGRLDFEWQPRFYDRVIRGEDELNRIREYIINNPVNWSYEKSKSDIEILFS